MSGWGDLRLVPAAAAAWSVALAAMAGRAAGAWLVLAVLAALAVAAARRSLAPAVGLAVVAGAAVLVTSAAGAEARAWVEDRVSAGHVGVRGRAAEVRELDSSYGGEPRVVVRLALEAGQEGAGAWEPAAGTVTLIADAVDAPPRGAAVEARGVLEEAAGGTVDALLDGRIVAWEPPSGWRARAEAARAGLEQALRGVHPTMAALVRGMVLGDTSGMPEALVTQMRVSGLAHLTAVSGAHFAILAAAVGGVARRLRLTPVAIAGIVLGACVALAAVVSGGGSVDRALGMAAVTAVATLAGRRSQAMPALAATVVVLMVVRPTLATDVGLGLSVSAVASIALLAPGLAARAARCMAPALAEIVAVTVAAQAACLPLLAAIDAEVGPWAVPANAVATPFAVPVTLAGAGALALATALPGAAVGLAHVAGWAAWPVVVAARAFAEAPGGGLRWPPGAIGFAAGIGVLAGVATAARAGRRAAAIAGACACVLAVAVQSPAARWLPAELGGPLRGWTVVACDVGQGDALVARAGGAVVMVDAGLADGSAAACLRRLGVTRVDLLVLTHEHADHTGGIAEVREAAEVVRAWAPWAASERTVAALAGISAEVPSAGDRASPGELAVTVLQTGPEPRGRDGTEVNDSSHVVRIDAGGLAVLALGDLELDGQRRLLGHPGLAAIDVVKVAHHGSATQDATLARAVGAPVALVSVGAGNDHGHPAPETVGLYRASGAAVLRTDECGDVALAERDGAVVLVGRCRSGVAG